MDINFRITYEILCGAIFNVCFTEGLLHDLMWLRVWLIEKMLKLVIIKLKLWIVVFWVLQIFFYFNKNWKSSSLSMCANISHIAKVTESFWGRPFFKPSSKPQKEILTNFIVLYISRNRFYYVIRTILCYLQNIIIKCYCSNLIYFTPNFLNFFSLFICFIAPE